MGMLRYLTAGESHGKALLALVDGFPAGVELKPELIDAELHRRQGGYGRGGRQRLESDRVDVLSGAWRGLTLGSPIALLIPNKDHASTVWTTSPSPAGPWRSERSDQVSGLDPRRPGAGQRQGNGRPRGRRRIGQATSHPAGHHRLGYVTAIGPLVIEPKPGTLDEQRALRDPSDSTP